jgi:hypothetical protein
MRAREFTINIPINIKINGDGDPEISTGDVDDTASKEPETDTFVPPLQQKIEILKKSAGLPNVFDQDAADEDGPFE